VDAHARLCPNDSEVAAKVLDGEAIIIRLSDGLYFSMSGSGALVWELIERRRTIGEIVAGVVARYGATEGDVRADLTGLAAELLRERLVVTTDEPLAVVAEDLPDGGDRRPYERPELHGYQDMADLLALDPPAPGMANVVWRDPSEHA
jgi:hypothetical protein